MKPLPPPPVPGSTDAERMDYAVRALLAAPKVIFDKQAITRREKRRKKQRAAKKH